MSARLSMDRHIERKISIIRAIIYFLLFSGLLGLHCSVNAQPILMVDLGEFNSWLSAGQARDRPAKRLEAIGASLGLVNEVAPKVLLGIRTSYTRRGDLRPWASWEKRYDSIEIDFIDLQLAFMAMKRLKPSGIHPFIGIGIGPSIGVRGRQEIRQELNNLISLYDDVSFGHRDHEDAYRRLSLGLHAELGFIVFSKRKSALHVSVRNFRGLTSIYQGGHRSTRSMGFAGGYARRLKLAD